MSKMFASARFTDSVFREIRYTSKRGELKHLRSRMNYQKSLIL